MLAANAGSIGILEKFIEQGAKVSHTDGAGATALHLANTLELTQALISAGAAINAQDNELRTPLHRQVEDESGSVQCLLDAGASVNLKDSTGDSPLHMACIYREDTLRLMLKHNPDLSLTDKSGRTPLQIANMLHDDESAKIIRKYLASS